MKLEEQLKQVQQKLDLIKVYQRIETLPVLPVRFRKKDNISEAIKKQVHQEVIEFARKRIAEVESTCGLREESPKPEASFTLLDNEEIGCLKLLAQKVLSKPVAKEVPVVKKESKPVEKRMIKEESKSKEPISLSTTYRILALSNINPPKFAETLNAYDEVKMLGQKGNIATVESITNGNRFEIPIEDLEVK